MTIGPSDTMQLNNHTDLEVGSSHLNADGADDFSDPFDIANTKNASFQALKRWRVRLSSAYSLFTNIYIPAMSMSINFFDDPIKCSASWLTILRFYPVSLVFCRVWFLFLMIKF